jgi:TonB-linked SusC/RagA family outer membrane protein
LLITNKIRMKKKLEESMFDTASCSNRRWKLLLTKGFLFLWITFSGLTVFAQNTQTVKGRVTDETGDPLLGVSVVLKNNAANGTVTDAEGNFMLAVPAGKQTLKVTSIGMLGQEVTVSGTAPITIVLKEDTKLLGEVVVVGFGQQKKESVIGAITQTSGKVLERAGGVSSIGAALTGNLPGVVTTASTGMPGEEDPRILIRGRSSWNNANPLILVDGIERDMTAVDINSVESISVLKDASATAVFGVRGANGVILVTTKRGKLGKATINANVSTSLKTASKLPAMYDAYDDLSIRNTVVERELGYRPEAWAYITPQNIMNKYRNPANTEEWERYPNVNWKDELLKDFAQSYKASIDISGGTPLGKYFTNVDFLNEGDLYKKVGNDRGYQSGYTFNRVNVRSNLDFTLTKSTTMHVNLSGSHGVKKKPFNRTYEFTIWATLYGVAPDVFRPKYSDGVWGYYRPMPTQTYSNSVEAMAIGGIEYITNDKLTTDFNLEQDLGMLLKGLKIRGLLSFDNTFIENHRGLNDTEHWVPTLHEWIDPETGIKYYDQTIDANNKFDFQNGIHWYSMAGSMDNKETFRKLYYSGQINYANKFGNHNVTAMGDFSREENAKGSIIPSYRENWVFRATYDFASRYFVEYNGAYNGSEKFAPQNRFAFFQSGALGWLISEEPYIKKLNFNWLDMLKLRGSYGQIGDDQVDGRWLYMTTWNYNAGTDGNNRFHQGLSGVSGSNSPYAWYSESGVGNPNVQWETITKLNFGVDLAIFRGLLNGTFDFFKDKRDNILIKGADRAIPSYYGAIAPTANLGRVNTKGFEMELRLNKMLNKDFRLWGNFNYTHAQDKIIKRDDPELLPEYQKKAGKPNDLPSSYLDYGYINNWDELYGSTPHDNMDDARMPGSYVIMDYDANGIISSFDNVPYGYPGTPQNTFSTTLGVDYKGWNFFVQFYGVTNVTRQVVLTSLGGTRNTVFKEGSYWSKDNMNADVPLPRWSTKPSDYSDGARYMYDGSYLRLKNVELGYTFSQDAWIKSLGLSSLKIYMNGDNLWLYTKMPDDRESNFAGTGWASQGAYPTVKRLNFGLRITL